MDVEYFNIEDGEVLVMKLPFRIDLNVPFEEKDLAKNAGARWDQDRKVWYAPADASIPDLFDWIPLGCIFSRQFYIATSEQKCWNCKQVTEVVTIIALSGFYTYKSPLSEYFGMAAPFHWPSFVREIETINKSALTQLNSFAPYFYFDRSKTTGDEHFMNHCQLCRAKQGEHFLYEEPEGAFLPAYQPSKITVKCVGGDLKVDAFRSEIDPEIGRQIKWPVPNNASY